MEDKLFFNRESLTSTISYIAVDTDNRLDNLHAARCLPWATCSAGKLWLHARLVMGDKGHSGLSTYDMGSIGLGGCISAKGWVELRAGNSLIGFPSESLVFCPKMSK